MRVGIFADVHDHLDNLRRVVALFNERHCEAVLFAGDLVSTFAVPPLRKLTCPFFGCFGDNEGNRAGLLAGMSIVGELRDAPALYQLDDGTRVVVMHMERQLRGFAEPFDVAICGHTHKPVIARDQEGRLWINPGETSGWTSGNPTVALLDTSTMTAEIVPLYSDAPPAA
jgi:putative phosphoesterase